MPRENRRSIGGSMYHHHKHMLLEFDLAQEAQKCKLDLIRNQHKSQIQQHQNSVYLHPIKLFDILYMKKCCSFIDVYFFKVMSTFHGLGLMQKNILGCIHL